MTARRRNDEDLDRAASIVKSALPDPKTQPWPMGDVLPTNAPPAGVDMAKVQAAVEAAFDPAGMTAAFVITYKGVIPGNLALRKAVGILMGAIPPGQ